MLENPDMMPNATINRWIDNIKLFHFTLRHKNGATFGPDGLSRRLPQPEDEVYPNPFEENEDPEDRRKWSLQILPSPNLFQ